MLSYSQAVFTGDQAHQIWLSILYFKPTQQSLNFARKIPIFYSKNILHYILLQTSPWQQQETKQPLKAAEEPRYSKMTLSLIQLSH